MSGFSEPARTALLPLPSSQYALPHQAGPVLEALWRKALKAGVVNPGKMVQELALMVCLVVDLPAAGPQYPSPVRGQGRSQSLLLPPL